MSRILVFSPYASRYHLLAYEATIAKACELRGATVEYVLCDGLLPECDMHWDSFDNSTRRPVNICESCQARSRRNFGFPEFDLPHRWLGELVSAEERRTAFEWAQTIGREELTHGRFADHAIGEWVLSSVVSYFRQYPPDLTNWHVVNVYRGFLLSGSLVATALTNYLKMHSVDSALLFNGRQSITRVAFEIYRAHGLRVLTHETPFYQRGHLMLKPNARCWSMEPFHAFWRDWGEVPLDRATLDKTLAWLRNRRYAKGLSWHPYNNPYLKPLSVDEELALDPNRKLLALFTSSTDEVAGDPELEGPFESQSTWVREVVNWVKGRDDVELVIRVHPHLAGNTGLGRAVDEFTFYQEMKSALPANVRIVMPDDTLNSYALMEAADVCLSYGSSVGIEMAMLGKPVVLASRAFYEAGVHILTVKSKQDLAPMLERSLGRFSVRELRREAFRLAYYYVFDFEVPFPLVLMSGVMDAKLTYSRREELAPGQDATLDRICNHLIAGEPLFATPDQDARTRTTADEDAFLADVEKLRDPMRDLDYERRLRRRSQLMWLGRKTQSVVQRVPFGVGRLLNTAGKAIYLPVSRWLANGD